jgi:hypothetical protein
VLQELASTRSVDGLELVFSYLDDLCLAGDAQLMLAALNTLKARVLSRDKCELILVGGAASTVDVGLFPSDFKVVRDGNFELLGGPIGSPAFCNQHTQARVDKATRVLDALGEVPDPQVALQLLRRCAGFSKMVYSIRAVPPTLHSSALQDFDAKIRACFEQFTCLHPDDEQWAQATLSTDSGGLGLRSLAQHSHAAFLASRSNCVDLCKQLDEAHVLVFSDGYFPAHERLATDAYNTNVNGNRQLPSGGLSKLSQKELSEAIDERMSARLSAPETTSQARRAHLKLVSASGAGLFLHAVPSKEARLDNEPALYRVMIQRWLRMPLTDQDCECPCCDGVLDRFGDHALVCCGGGDRTRRHNLLRNIVFYEASACGLHPELEKPGLLPQRPLCGSLFENGDSVCDSFASPSARRPADVYIPRWRAGPPAAWDFAVTSGMQLDMLTHSIRDPDAALTRYEDLKCNHQDTRTLCQTQGITFIPMVMEAVGGSWGSVARGVWSALAKTSALATGELQSERTCAILLRQRLSMTLHRENARACAKRFGGF